MHTYIYTYIYICMYTIYVYIHTHIYIYILSVMWGMSHVPNLIEWVISHTWMSYVAQLNESRPFEWGTCLEHAVPAAIVYVHIYTYVHIFVYIYEYIHVYLYTFIHIYTHIYVNVCICICVCIYVKTCSTSRGHLSYVFTYINVYIHLYIQTYIYKYIHTCIHVYTYMWVCILIFICMCIYTCSTKYQSPAAIVHGDYSVTSAPLRLRMLSESPKVYIYLHACIYTYIYTWMFVCTRGLFGHVRSITAAHVKSTL